jgi:hypothetical protein
MDANWKQAARETTSVAIDIILIPALATTHGPSSIGE